MLSLCLDTQFMQYYGQGYCDGGSYAGWDGQGDKSEEDCKHLCLLEYQCTFASYYNEADFVRNGTRKTCSRYKELKCLLSTLWIRNSEPTSIGLRHKTFKKRFGEKKGE